jgi:ferredoxin
MMEQGMLDFAGKTAPGARLSCQILVTESLEGLTVHVPTSQ